MVDKSYFLTRIRTSIFGLSRQFHSD